MRHFGLRSALSLGALLALTSSATAQDAGPAQTAPLTCGDTLDDEGLCFGDVAAWCSEPNPSGGDASAPTERLDCAALVIDGRSIDGSCSELADFGAWCGVSMGEPCVLPSADGARQLACLEAGVLDVDGACDLVAGCLTTSSGCTPGCDGAFLTLSCASFGQALGVDCAALGATCTADRCEGVARDGPCSAELACAAGLICVGAADGAGACLPDPEVADRAGSSLPDAPDPAPGCSAGGVRGRSPVAALALFLLFLGRIRRSG